MPEWPRLTGRMESELVVEPLAAEHEAGLLAAGQDQEVWTYLTAFPDARPWWRTGANIETKLLLRRAFEVLDCERVEL